MTNINFSLSRTLGQALMRVNYSLTVAESCTGGGLAQEITAVAGSSGWFDRGFVTYTNAAKIELLDVPKEMIEKHGAVSGETAQAMVQGALAKSHADVAIAITGIAGPAGGDDDKPVGTVWFGLAMRDQNPKAQRQLFTGGRKNIRMLSIGYALNWLLIELNKKK